LEKTLGIEKFSQHPSQIGLVAKNLSSKFKLSLDIITRLIDCLIVTANPDIAGNSSKIYLYSILRDLVAQGDVKVEDIDGIHECLLGLSKPPPATADEEPKRKSVRRK
jgi:flagellin-specific chaperone FliS